MSRLRSGDVAGAVADLGILVPLGAALILVNGLHPGPLLLLAGLLSLAAGAWFRIPFPVQPLKALTALAVAQQLSPEVIHAAGLLIGGILIVLAATGLADRIAILFTEPVIRSLQLAVGSLLIVGAVDLARHPPALFASSPSSSWALGLALATLIGAGMAVRYRWYPAIVVVVVAGTVVAAIVGDPQFGSVVPTLPTPSLPAPAVWGSAFVLLVIPQLPLTYGNAVVGVSDLARELFPDASRVTPGAVALSCGVGNVAASLLGGMPMCHGSSGLSAHVRLGARTAAMNVLLGGSLVVLGVVFPSQVLELFSLLPVWALAGLLAYAGLRHALLVLSLSGGVLAMAVGAAAVGVVTGNLAITTGLALAAVWVPRMRRGSRRRVDVHP
jgi:sulfate permease, SulP family